MATRGQARPDVEVEVFVAAAADVVWELVGDPTRMSEWSPELVRSRWIGGARGPAVGHRFRGHNRIGPRRWSTVCTVVTHEPGREVAWDVTSVGLPVARWSYRLEPGEGGTVLRASFEDHRGTLVTLAGRVVRGVADVRSHNRAGLIRTLAAVRAAAEER